ncbi:MAG: Biotin transporter BioY2 [Chlamydiae bacterium]|nr:Biotin transporter BioY2 [Chlamydiota bacterium]
MNSIIAKRSIPAHWPLVQVVLASCFIGLCAQISIPLYYVPFTGQTFGVMLVGATLGKRAGFFAALLYLLEGCAGCPVFAGGAGGLHCLLGPTGGYLIAYPLQAYGFGWLFERTKRRMPLAMGIACGQLAMGTFWLIPFIGAKNSFLFGFYPFITIEAIKALLVFSITSNERRKK